jgi:hypothetical protein
LPWAGTGRDGDPWADAGRVGRTTMDPVATSALAVRTHHLALPIPIA